MLVRAYLFVFAFLVCIPALSQVEPAATGGAPPVADDTQMMTPPPVSGTLYPNVAGAEARTNYAAAAVRVDGAYVDNVLPGATAKPVSDVIYSILPTLSLDRTTPRQQATMTYSPAFTFYQPTSVLNAVDQSAALTFQYRLSPSVAINLQDFFMRTSNVFNQSYPFSAGGIAGSTQTPIPAVIAPFAEQLRNTANAAITYQFGKNGMIGAGGSVDVFNLPNPSAALGLYNSNGGGGQAFYSRRFASMQYGGVVYQYDRTLTYPVNAQVEIQTHTWLPFYTLYFNRTFSISLSAGAQYVEVAQSQLPMFSTWLPTAVASIGWQGLRGTFAASYLRTITAGDGLVGAFTSNGVNLSGGWKLSRTWSTGLSASYATIDTVAQLPALTYQGGNTFTAEISLEHAIGEHFTAELGYDRLHESFNGIAVISENPDSNREFVTVTYEFRKPLGR